MSTFPRIEIQQGEVSKSVIVVCKNIQGTIFLASYYKIGDIGRWFDSYTGDVIENVEDWCYPNFKGGINEHSRNN